MIERQIKSLPSDGSLAKARIKYFATHGLLEGESKEILKEKAEPSLILTPPDRVRANDDRFLTASEITLLKLDAAPVSATCDVGHSIYSNAGLMSRVGAGDRLTPMDNKLGHGPVRKQPSTQ